MWGATKRKHLESERENLQGKNVKLMARGPDWPAKIKSLARGTLGNWIYFIPSLHYLIFFSLSFYTKEFLLWIWLIVNESYQYTGWLRIPVPMLFILGSQMINRTKMWLVGGYEYDTTALRKRKPNKWDLLILRIMRPLFHGCFSDPVSVRSVSVNLT